MTRGPAETLAAILRLLMAYVRWQLSHNRGDRGTAGREALEATLADLERP